jgi:hypothetical protein
MILMEYMKVVGLYLMARNSSRSLLIKSILIKKGTPMSRIALLVFITIFSLTCFAQDGWKVITGEMSILSQMKGKINRENVRAVISYNPATGEVRLLKSGLAGAGVLDERWESILETKPNTGGIEVLFAEHTLIMGMSTEDVDGQSLYGPFLLEKGTGRTWRILRNPSSVMWQELPAPMPVANGKWSLSSAEHTIAMSGMHRQNIYSVFLTEETTGTTYLIESHYSPIKGLIWDKLILISAGSKSSTISE